MLTRNICTLLVFAVIACTKPISHLVTHERRDGVPDGFAVKGPAMNTTMLSLRLALTSNNLDGLEAAVYKNAYRVNGVFKDHLTKEEVESFVSPTAETITKVTEWLSSNDVNFTTRTPAGDWLQINLNVATANQLLNANFMLFTDDLTGKEVIRTLSYSVPADLQPHIQLIHPTITFPIKVKQPSIRFTPKSIAEVDTNITSRGVPSTCNANEVTPACLAAFYGLPLTTAAQTASQIAVGEFFEQFVESTDLSTFLEDFTPNIPSTVSFTLQTINGGSNPQSPRDAGTLSDANVEYTVGLAVNVPVTVISVGEDNANEDDLEGFMDLTELLLSEPSPQQVLLVTFSFNEVDVPAGLAQMLCNNYMQLAARGVSVIVSAGDGGVSGSQETCTTFVAAFPATCPFVTSVGATQGFSPETPLPSNSGGFSNIFPIPLYQSTAVSQYLNTIGSTNAGLFNRSGRGFPDVSAQGENIALVVGGEHGTADGTAISATIFASIVALLNADFISSGNPPLGLLNPLLYEFSSAFNDITSGDNPGCGTSGFPATIGWDPVSGVGTPIFADLVGTKGF